jgi:tetratricopeptide (TPR) repeat protein
MKMKKAFLYLTLLFSLIVCAQNEQLALHYYEKGQFEKALITYQDLLKSQPGNSIFFQKTIDCHQQLKQFDLAEKSIQTQWNRYKQAPLLVELGYNYQLQQNEAKATKNYNQALEQIKNNPSEVYGVAAAFERKTLIDYALQSYELALKLEPQFNFNFQMALLYGQKGAFDKMIEKFLTESFQNQQNTIPIQSQLSLFMTDENNAGGFNDLLRKALLVRVQKEQDVFWNQFLSWFYIQRKEYAKAFVQEKAI